MSTDPLLDRAVWSDSAQNGAFVTPASRAQSRWRRVLNVLVAKAPSNGARVAESLDYEPVQNDLYLQHVKERRGTRHVYGYSGLTFAKNLVMILTGILTGLVCVGLNKGVSTLIKFRNSTMAQLVDTHDSAILAFLMNLSYGVSLTAIAACMVTFWAPAAAGAGVTLVMAYLNGNHIPNLLRMRTLITKVVGAMCSVASGLAIGPEGPMVHIGSCIASNITYVRCSALLARFTLWGRCGPTADEANGEGGEEEDEASVVDSVVDAPRKGAWCATWEELHEDSEHREFIAAGAAAGLSAAFGAPIGGVLFSMEEACSFWSRKQAWRCFVTTILAVFTVSQLSENGTAGIIVFTNVHTLENAAWLHQFPFMVAVAVLGGGLGAAFNALRRMLWRVRASRSRKFLRVGEALATILFCVCAQFVVAHWFGQCVDTPSTWPEGYRGVAWQCQEGKHNDLATGFWSSPDELISRLFSVGHTTGSTEEITFDSTGFTQQSLVLFSAVYLLMLALCAGVCVPAGMFMPAIVLGAASGLAAGVALQQTLPHFHIQPGVYALICATASLTGVFRSAISLVVLVVEGTRGINFLFGVIIAVVVANFVGSALGQDGVYESEIERDGNVFFLPTEPRRILSTLTAEQVMVPHPTCLPALVSVSDVLAVLSSTTHHGFPVITGAGGPSDEPDGAVGQLEGLVLRSQLLVLLRKRVWSDADGRLLNPAHGQQAFQFRIERTMRLFYRLRYTHHRYMATADPTVETLNTALLRSTSLPGSGGSCTEPAVDSSVAQDTVFASGADARGVQFGEMQELRQTVCDDRVQEELDQLADTLVNGGSPAGLYLDLRPYMNSAPLTVQRKMLASRVHRTFVTLGMRHLCVVNHRNRIVGIITRKDLEHAAEAGHHGHSTPNTPVLTVSRSIVASSSGVRLRLPDGRRSRGPAPRLAPVGEADGDAANGDAPNGSAAEHAGPGFSDNSTVEIDVGDLIAGSGSAPGGKDGGGDLERI
eukprot:jgi/Ulvmu1/2614/UM014_0065.1